MFNFLRKFFSRKEPDYKTLVNNGAIILDVRSPAEFQVKHIEGSRNISVERVSGKAAELKLLGKPVITVCKSGVRSGMAKSVLASEGIEAYNGGRWYQLEKKLR